jgi:hypothetical protein
MSNTKSASPVAATATDAPSEKHLNWTRESAQRTRDSSRFKYLHFDSQPPIQTLRKITGYTSIWLKTKGTGRVLHPEIVYLPEVVLSDAESGEEVKLPIYLAGTTQDIINVLSHNAAELFGVESVKPAELAVIPAMVTKYAITIDNYEGEMKHEFETELGRATQDREILKNKKILAKKQQLEKRLPSIIELAKMPHEIKPREKPKQRSTGINKKPKQPKAKATSDAVPATAPVVVATPVAPVAPRRLLTFKA